MLGFWVLGFGGRNFRASRHAHCFEVFVPWQILLKYKNARLRLKTAMFVTYALPFRVYKSYRERPVETFQVSPITGMPFIPKRPQPKLLVDQALTIENPHYL